MSKKTLEIRQWCFRPLISAFGRQRQADLCESESSLVYRVSSRMHKMHRKPVTKRNKQKKRKREKYVVGPRLQINQNRHKRFCIARFTTGQRYRK